MLATLVGIDGIAEGHIRAVDLGDDGFRIYIDVARPWIKVFIKLVHGDFSPIQAVESVARIDLGTPALYQVVRLTHPLTTTS
jgi:hypothetical protein